MPEKSEYKPPITSTELPQPPIEVPPTTVLETAIIQATPEAEKAPPWFKDAVKKITDMWFNPKSFESEEMYERLGMKAMQGYYKSADKFPVYRLMYKKFGMEKWAQHEDSSPLKKMETFTRFYESIHLFSCAGWISLIMQQAAEGRIALAAALTVSNTLVNVAPIMVQRYNRIRLYRTINRIEERQANQNQPNIASTPKPG